MKAITQDFKNNVKLFGRELDSIITYELDGDTIELGNEQLNSVSPHYEGGILKSVMKQLDIDSNVDIPLETIINYQFGIKVRDDDVEDYRDNYDYINFGNYVVYKTEKQEDTNSYKITCYDKLLYSMKDYENLNIAYPISVREYINIICTYLGITFANASDSFANYDKLIPSELYISYNSDSQQWESLGYTFRDVLDELAEVTASTICINNDDELEIRYITDTGDTIDEEYLKDINVNFGESYGPINSIVLSRSAGADNVYLRDEQSVETNGLCEIKIIDNQIMNFNDRSDYLTDILYRLNGLTYYINDFSSTGITYYDLCDRYTIQIGENQYSCIMLNDDIQITQGLQENVYTDLPEESVTDYTKADSTDRRINQTYLIVDKQNQQIESVITNVTEQNNKISQITQTVDELTSQISDISDITTSGETYEASFNISEINDSEPIMLRIRPVVENISYLYPRANLYPSSTLYMPTRIINFHNNSTNENISYTLPDDLLYYDSTHYDEFYLDYESETCQIIKRCKYNADGTVALLDNERVDDYSNDYPEIHLTTGDYTISLLGYSNGYIFARLMATNIYTTQFYTKAETDSRISQKANEIELGVNQTLSNYSTTAQMNSAINIKANEISSTVSETYATKTTTNQLSSRISQTAKNISLSVNNGSTSSGITIGITKEDGTTTQATGTIEMNGLVKFSNLTDGTTTISGSNIKTGTIDASQVNVTNINASNITGGTISGNRINGGTITGTSINVGTDLRVGNNIYVGSNQSNTSNVDKTMYLTTDAYLQRIRENNVNTLRVVSNGSVALWTGTRYFGLNSGGTIVTNASVTPWSDKRLKTNIKDIDVNWIKDLHIKEFEYKDNDKKQIGLIAQDYENEEYSKYFLNKSLNPIDGEEYFTINYSNITNALIKYCQELEKRIEKLERESDK